MRPFSPKKIGKSINKLLTNTLARFDISANSMQLKTLYFFLFFFFCTLYPNLPRYLPSAKYSPWEYIIRFASLI